MSDDPIFRQGAININADIDTRTISALRKDAARNKQSIYPHAKDPGVWTVAEREIAFVMSNQRNSGKPSVLTALNGQGTAAAAAFAGRENARELVKMAIRNNIQPMGTIVESVSVDPDSSVGPQTMGVAVDMYGLETVCQSPWSPFDIRVGELVEAVLPGSDNTGMHGGGRGINNAGEPGISGKKFRLEAAPVDPTTAGRNLRLVIQQLKTDPNAWVMAMGGHLRGTHMWLSAGRTVAESYLLGALLVIGVLIRQGHLQPAGGLQALLANLQAGAAPSLEDTSEDAVVALAQALSLRAVPSGGLRQQLSAQQRAAFGLLKHELISTVFYDGVDGRANKRFEFAYRQAGAGGVPSSKALTRNNEPKRFDPYGEVVTAQANLLVRAVGAFHDAILDQQRFIIGKCVTATSQSAVKKVRIAMGVCKP